MRRWMFIAVLSMALLTMPLWPQRGGQGGIFMGSARAGFVSHRSGMTGSRTLHGSGHSGNTGHYYYHYGYRPYYPRYYRFYRYGYPYFGYPVGIWYGGVLSDWSDSSNSYPELGVYGSQDAQSPPGAIGYSATTKVNADRGVDFQPPGQ